MVFIPQSRNVWRLYQPTRSSYFTTAMKNSHCTVKRMFDVYWIDHKPKSLGSQMLPKQPIAAFVWKSFSFHCTALTFFALATTQLCCLPVPALFWRVFQRSKNTFYDPKSKCSWLDNTCGKEVFFHLFFKREMYQIALLYIMCNRTGGRFFLWGEGICRNRRSFEGSGNKGSQRG